MNKEMEAARELALGDLRSRLTEPLRADERTIYRQAFEDGYNAHASRQWIPVSEAALRMESGRGKTERLARAYKYHDLILHGPEPIVVMDRDQLAKHFALFALSELRGLIALYTEPYQPAADALAETQNGQ